ncbi:MAG: leucine-rich repeat domain-containing protein, partial [Clostridiales bacterium]|nr:leucine-rich repeat domain-containing protein [Clostridiales bacterium]
RIPRSVSFINGGAFAHCGKLERIEVAQDNPQYHSSDNCVYHTRNKWLIIGRNDGRLPDGDFTCIFDDAFAGNTRVKELVVPRGVTSIGAAAFRDCVNLRRAVLPDTLESIGRCAFEGCASLEEITVPCGVKNLEGMAFRKSGVKRAVIKRGVETIDDDAFGECAALCELYIPSSVKQAWSPLGLSSGENTRAVRVYIEVSDEKNYERWIEKLGGFCDVVLGCDSEIFD